MLVDGLLQTFGRFGKVIVRQGRAGQALGGRQVDGIQAESFVVVKTGLIDMALS